MKNRKDTTSVAPVGYPALLADLADQISLKMIGRNIDAKSAAETGLEVAEFIRIHWGGQSVYIPSGAPNATKDRYEEIFNKFNGVNHSQLAREYGISTVRVYQIINQARKEKKEKRGLDE